jgi:hypothetical protein
MKKLGLPLRSRYKINRLYRNRGALANETWSGKMDGRYDFPRILKKSSPIGCVASFRQNKLPVVFKEGMVGATGFEPVTTRTPSVCATRLRYAPTAVSSCRKCNISPWLNQFKRPIETPATDSLQFFVGYFSLCNAVDSSMRGYRVRPKTEGPFTLRAFFINCYLRISSSGHNR